MILVHRDGNFRIQFCGGLDQAEEIQVFGKLARTAAGLHNHRRLGFLRRHHDGLNLFHVIDVECADAVSALGGLVEKLLSHGD